MSRAPRAGWHCGPNSWTQEGGTLRAVPRAARRAAGERNTRHRYRQRRAEPAGPPPEVYRLDAAGTLRRQARIPLWQIRVGWVSLSAADRARMLAQHAHADRDGVATTPRDTTAREMARRACTVTRADKRLRRAGWLATRARRISRKRRLTNEVRLLVPAALQPLQGEIERRLAGESRRDVPGLQADDVYTTAEGVRRVRSALVFGWEIEHPDVQAALKSPVAGQVWLVARSVLASGPRRLSRLELAELAGLVATEDLTYADDPVLNAERDARCRDARKRVSEAVVGLEALGLVRVEREPGAASRYHLLVPRGCEAFLPALAELTPRAWGATPERPAAPTPCPGPPPRPEPEPRREPPPPTGLCPSCGRPSHFDRAVPREGWFDYCCDEAHAGQVRHRCPACDGEVDGELVTFDPAMGVLVCGHCDAHGRATYPLSPPRRPGARMAGEPAIEDGPPPALRRVDDDAAGRVVRAYLEALPASVRARRRVPRPTAAELDAARVLVAHGGAEHAAWCARRVAAQSGAGPFFPPDAASRLSATA